MPALFIELGNRKPEHTRALLALRKAQVGLIICLHHRQEETRAREEPVLAGGWGGRGWGGGGLVVNATALDTKDLQPFF